MPNDIKRLIFLLPCLLWLATCTSAPKYRKHPPDIKPSPAGKREEIVQIATSFIGTPYRAGGKTRKGVDCSGLVMAVYREAGIQLPRTSLAQSRLGEKVPRSRAEPGDLVFFATTGRKRISHVGIYIGKGEFIHASTRARRVRIDSLGQLYFRHRFVIARRLF